MSEQKDVTMWSESLFDGLYLALRKNKRDALIIGLIKEIKEKGYPPARIVSLVEDNVSPAAGRRVQTLLSGRPTPQNSGKAPASSATATKAKKQKSTGGFTGWLMSLFR